MQPVRNIMQFHEKFAYMYHLLNLNHKQVSKQTGFDVSLLSRWKNGKRLPSEKNGQYHELSNLFLNSIKTQTQRDTINMIIAGHRTNIPHVNLDIDIFEDWLKTSSSKPEISLMNYSTNTDALTQLRAIITGDDPIIDRSHIKLDALTRTDVYVYKNNSGKREAVLYFLSTALELEYPTDIYIFSDEDPGWWIEDENFPRMWATYLRAITLKGHNLNTIFLTTRPSDQYIRALNTWLPLMLYGRINTFYFPNYTVHTVKSTTFIIKDTICYISLSSQLSDVEKIGYLHLDLPSIQMQTALFLGRMAECRSLVTTYTAETQLSLLERMLQTESMNFPVKSFNQFPSPMFLPITVFERYASTLPVDIGQRYMSLVRKYLTIHENLLPSVEVKEAVPFKTLRDLIIDPTTSFYESRFFASRDMKLTKAELKQYLNNIVEVLNRYPYYELTFLHRQNAYKDMHVSITVRQHTVAVMTPIKPSPLEHIAIFTTEGNTVLTLYKYLTTLQQQIPSAYHQKDETLQSMRELLRLLP